MKKENKNKNKNEKLIFKIIKEVIKIFIIVILIIIIVVIIFRKNISPMTCSTYGTNYEEIKIGKRYYCCEKNEYGDHEGCIQISDNNHK